LRLSPRSGYVVVSIGTVLEFLGLMADSWSSGSHRILSFDQPGDYLLVLGLAITVLGTILGFLSLSEELSLDVSRPPRLLPALPLVLLVGIAIGSVAFAYQASDGNSSGGAPAVEAAPVATPTSGLTEATATPQCPPETFWLPTTQQCLSITTDASGNRTVATPVPAGATPVCPPNTVWHPAGVHCLSTVCPAGFSFNYALFECRQTASYTPVIGIAPTPVCPPDTIWHPAGNHCLSTVCPVGYAFDAALFECVQAGGPTPVPTATPTLVPGETPTATPEVSPTNTPAPTPACPEGYFWHPLMGHCMSNTCPPGLVFNYETLFCELPSTGTPVATVTTTSTPTMTSTPTRTATPTATPTGQSDTPVPTPSCPKGYFWNPMKGHCDSTECPTPLIWDPVNLYCILPPDWGT
jgi:hypothetical protein